MADIYAHKKVLMSFGQQLETPPMMLSLGQCSRNCPQAFSCNISTRRWWDGSEPTTALAARTCVDKPLALLGILVRPSLRIFGTGRPTRSEPKDDAAARGDAATSHNRVPHIQLRRDGHRHCHRPSRLPRWLGGNDATSPPGIALLPRVFVSIAPAHAQLPGRRFNLSDDCYDDLQGSPAENYINTADCQFLLFDADRKLLRPIFFPK